MGKAKSKRISLKQRKKVDKKVREHHRKVRKASKSGGIHKAKKNASISALPNSWPEKAQLLEEMQLRKEQETEKRKLIASRLGSAKHAEMGSERLSNLLLTQAGSNQHGSGERKHGSSTEMTTAQQRIEFIRQEKHIRELRKVIESADVLLEVLDARDPIGTRARTAERTIMKVSGGKKRIILLLNKVDLVPREVASKWLQYLRNELPTVAFCADASKRNVMEKNVMKHKHESQAHAASAGTALGGESHNLTGLSGVYTNDSGSVYVGTDALLQLLKNYARVWDGDGKAKSCLTVGIIGYPNVGKSSVINAMKRSRSAVVGPTPGVTKTAQEFSLDKHLKLVDCPGIVFDTKQGNSQSSLVLKNVVRIEALADPISHVQGIVDRVGKEVLQIWFALPVFDSVHEFLALVAKTRGKIGKKGVFDLDAAARLVLSEWNSGKIPFYTLPPKGPKSSQLGAKILDKYSSFGLDVSNLEKVDDEVLGQVGGDGGKEYGVVEAVEGMESMDGDGDGSEVLALEKVLAGDEVEIGKAVRFSVDLSAGAMKKNPNVKQRGNNHDSGNANGHGNSRRMEDDDDDENENENENGHDTERMEEEEEEAEEAEEAEDGEMMEEEDGKAAKLSNRKSLRKGPGPSPSLSQHKVQSKSKKKVKKRVSGGAVEIDVGDDRDDEAFDFRVLQNEDGDDAGGSGESMSDDE